MESGVEHTHLRQARHQLAHGTHTFQVGRIMERSQVDATLKGVEHLVVEQHALVELLAAMHHAVAHSIYLLEVLDGPYLSVGKQGEDEFHALGMLRDIMHDGLLLAIGKFHFHESAVHTHTLSATRGHYLLGVHIVECILDRRRATV